MYDRRPARNIATIVSLAIGGVLVLILLLALSSFVGYAFFAVGSTEVGIKFNAGQPYSVVGPGVYTDLSLFADIQTINVQGLPFESKDIEVLTKDKQAIGVVVTGTVHRPDVSKADQILQNWASYSIFYLDNIALVGIPARDANATATPGLMQQLSKQAMKVCVGDSTFDTAVVGSARDELRNCIDGQLDGLAKGYGLEVRNVIVPEIELGKVRAQIDSITEARFNTQIAEQRALQAKADADRDLAVQQGAIRVTEGKLQEQTRQQTLTAKLEQERLAAQLAVIEQMKANELLTAQKDLEIQAKQREVAEQRAMADLASVRQTAAIYEQNPKYTDLEKAKAIAAAWKASDKVIVPAGTNPTIVIGGTALATVPTTP